MTRARVLQCEQSLKNLSIYCFGEVLWDCLPRGLFLGGAPCNVAYHLTRHGANATVVTAIGDDFLGWEILRRLAGWGVDSQFVAVDSTLPTGTVQVDISSGGPVYTIVEGVAWDAIPVSSALLSATSTADAVVYGTLALRTKENRESADRLLDASAGWKVLDINLRPPFIDPDGIDFAIRRADIVKLNDDELLTLTGASDPHERSEAKIARLASAFGGEYGIGRICVTCGARGAGLLWDGGWYWEDARPVTVRDTVGAGDAFLAGLLTGLLRGDAPGAALAKACRVGEFVAASDGATPDYPAAV